MKESFMLDYFMNSGLLCADEEDVKTTYSGYIDEDKAKLEKLLDKEQMQIVIRLLSNLSTHMFIMRDQECSKMFHLGIKLGIEIGEFNSREFED